MFIFPNTHLLSLTIAFGFESRCEVTVFSDTFFTFSQEYWFSASRTNTSFPFHHTARLFLLISVMHRLVQEIEMCTDVRSSVRPFFLWFACA